MATGGEEIEAFESVPDDWEYLGLESIEKACIAIYPDQPNPLQATAVIKSWLGGPIPLDYISIYQNNGDPDRNVPAHWHYISYGFTDLYGDGRIHVFSGPGQLSGFGFELTFRLKKQDGDEAPPMWPTVLLNKLANYVFKTGNMLQFGDHIPWHKPLDEGSESCIRHMLVALDPQLPSLDTPYGTLEFRQIVGVTDDEMKMAQRWKGAGVLELMATVQEIGPFFLTDMQRSESIFQIDPNFTHLVMEGINNDGSNLGHVTAVCLWIDINMSCQSEDLGALGVTDLTDRMEEGEPQTLEGVHLLFDAEAADLLLIIARARLMKGKYFLFHNANNQSIHLIPPDCAGEEGIFVNQSEPLKFQGSYLQIYCSESLLEQMSAEFEVLQESNNETPVYPREFRFSEPTILITVWPQGQLMTDASYVRGELDMTAATDT
ncbi:hypothetical protein ACJMK2_034990 [Sinanodonta woodiana]|uniref:Suppressor of fused homolog n=1 Tax=Sinanodonta woodiana TaxID=1069815 RepID=A0ABD3WTY4_SINWO